MCSVNGNQQSYTKISDTYKWKKIDTYLRSEENNYDSISVKYVFQIVNVEESLKSKSLKNALLNPITGQYQLGIFMNFNTKKIRFQICRHLFWWRKYSFVHEWYYFNPLVNRKLSYKIRKLVVIVQTFIKQYNIPHLSFKCERHYVDILEYSTWFIRMQRAIDKYCQLTLQ